MAKTSEEVQQESLARQFDNLRELPDGWDSYSAPAPSAESIDEARTVSDNVMGAGYVVAHVGASVLGGVGMTIESVGTEFAIECRNSGKLVVTEIRGDDDFTVHDLSNSRTRSSDLVHILGRSRG